MKVSLFTATKHNKPVQQTVFHTAADRRDVMCRRKMTKQEPVTLEQFVDLTRPLLGLPLTRAARTVGTCILLDFGKLHKTRKVRGKQCYFGDGSLLLESSWRVETSRSVLFGADSGDRKIDNQLERLVGRHITEVAVEGRLPELVVSLSGNRFIHSFGAIERSDRWFLFLRNHDCLYSKTNAIYIELCRT